MAIRLYHPNLDPPDNECEVKTEAQAAVYAESGWLPVPDSEERPGYAPEPTRYEPVVSKAKRSTKTEPVKGEGTDK